jgi:hypothetical protein
MIVKCGEIFDIEAHHDDPSVMIGEERVPYNILMRQKINSFVEPSVVYKCLEMPSLSFMST